MCHTYINKTLLLKSLQSYGINASAIKFQEFRGWQGWEAGIASLVLSLTCSVSQDTSPRFLYLIPDIFPALPIEITQSLRISEAPVGLKIPVHKIISKCTYHYRCVCSLLQQRDEQGKGKVQLPFHCWARRHPESSLESIPRDNSAGQGCDSEHFTPILNRHKETSQQLLTMISLGGENLFRAYKTFPLAIT